MKIINPRKISDIYAPGWNTFIDLNHEDREISIRMVPQWDGILEGARNGTMAWFGIDTEGRKLREVKALLKEIAPIYEKALEHYSSKYDENGDLIGYFRYRATETSLSVGQELDEISRIVGKFNS